jgi:hypothetical protein
MTKLVVPLLFLCLIVSACSMSDISIEGPKPNPTAVSRIDEGFPTEAVFCTDLGGTILIVGENFSPLPSNVMNSEKLLIMPQVFLLTYETDPIELEGVTFDQRTKAMSATIPTGLAVGVYDLRIINPNQQPGTLVDSIQIVPPPELSQIDPAVGCNELETPVVIGGANFRTASDGTIPAASLVGDDGAEFPLELVSFSSAAELTGTVPMGLEPGMYDLQVTNPEGCWVTLENAFEVVLPPELTAMNPNQAPNAVDVPVVISGNYFRVGASVYLTLQNTTDDYDLLNVTVSSATQIDATVPAGIPVGVYDLTIDNPDGCSDTLAGAYTALPPAILDLCASVDPAFGWVMTRTKIEICADNSDGNGLQSTPEVFILIPNDNDIIQEIPLIREAYLDPGPPLGNSIMSAVVPSLADDDRLVTGGAYDIKVVNPNGGFGIISSAFTLLPDPPPDILTMSPARGDKLTVETITVTGINFKTGLLSDNVTPIFSLEMLDPNFTVAASCEAGTLIILPDTPDPDVFTASCDMLLPETGIYVVRASHADDGSYDLYSAFAVTAPSGKLANQPLEASIPKMNVARRAHGIALGYDDLGNRFVYVAGGENWDADNSQSRIVDSVEISVLSNFGQLGNWREVENKLPEARTGVSLVNAGRYLYAIGGSPDGDTPAAQSQGGFSNVLRAKILGADTAPVIEAPTASAGGALAGGTWYYKVSAIMKDTTDNPLGETLPSDEESIRVEADSQVGLSWEMPDSLLLSDVDHFRVYRSAEANGLSGTEGLLADDIPVPQDGTIVSWIDDGQGVVDQAQVPLKTGAVGKWSEMPELNIPRYDAAAVVVQTGPDNAYLYVSGGRDGPLDPANGVDNVSVSTEWVAFDPMAPLGRDMVGNAFSIGPDLAQPRSEHALVQINHNNASALDPTHFYIAVVGGSAKDRGEGGPNAPIKDVESSLLDFTDGTPSAWIDTTVKLQIDRIGLSGIHVNNFLYAFNGWGGGGFDNFANDGEQSQSETIEDCTLSCHPDFDTMTSTTVEFDWPNDPERENAINVRYRSGLVFFGAYFYWMGGSENTNLDTTSNVTVQATYSDQ